MVLIKSNVAEIVEASVTKNIGLYIAAIDFQRDVLEHNFQIERNYGCKYLALIPENHGSDVALLEAAKGFMLTAMKSYLLQLQYRKDHYIKDQVNLQPMNRIQILEFFEGCNSLSKSPHRIKLSWLC